MAAGERPFETIIFHMMANVYMENCGNSSGNTCIRDQIQFYGRAVRTSHQANPVATPPWKQAGGPLETIIFNLMVNVYMETAKLQQLTLVSVTKSP